MIVQKIKDGAWYVFVTIPIVILLLIMAGVGYLICPENSPTTFHPWFAWRPILVKRYGCQMYRRIRWVSTVKRRATCNHDMISIRYWEYEDIQESNMGIGVMLNTLRRKTVTLLIKIGLPSKLARRIMPAEDKQELNEFVEGFKESVDLYNKRVDQFCMASSNFARWFTEKNVLTLTGGKLIAMDALSAMVLILGEEGVVTAFDRYVRDFPTFEATIVTFSQLPTIIRQELGWKSGPDEPGDVSEDDNAHIRFIVAREWTRALVRSTHGGGLAYGSYEALNTELRDLVLH